MYLTNLQARSLGLMSSMGTPWALWAKRIRSKKSTRSLSSSATHTEEACGINAVIPHLLGMEWLSDPGHCWSNSITLGIFWACLPRDCMWSAKETVSLKAQMVIHKLPIGGNNNHKLSRLVTTGLATLRMNFSHSCLDFTTWRRKGRNTAKRGRLERKSRAK